MKIIFTKISVGLLLLVFVSSSSVMAAETNKVGISVYDVNVSFPFFRNWLKDSVLKTHGSKAVYRKAAKLNPGDIQVLSDLKKREGKDFAAFSIQALSKDKRGFQFNWNMHQTDAADGLGKESVCFMLEMTERYQNKNIEDTIIADSLRGKINKLDVTYQDYGSGSHISRFDFSVTTSPGPTSKFWITTGEILFLNGLGMANYWINKHENEEDWEYKFNKEGYKTKITDGWSYDTNNFRTNTIYHMYAGASYYQAARSNGYGYAASTAFSMGGSMFWEYIGEFREQVSVNDTVFTPLAGSLLGEGLRVTSLYIERSFSKNIFRDFAIFLLDPMRVVNEWLHRVTEDTIRVNLTFINPAQSMLTDKLENRR